MQIAGMISLTGFFALAKNLLHGDGFGEGGFEGPVNAQGTHFSPETGRPSW